jgi:hypothetical protein
MSDQSVLVSPQSALARLLQQNKKRAADSPAVEPQKVAEQAGTALGDSQSVAIEGDALTSKPIVTVSKATTLGRLLATKKVKTALDTEEAELGVGASKLSQPTPVSYRQDSATQSLPTQTQSQDVPESIGSPETAPPAPTPAAKKRGRPKKEKQSTDDGASPAAAKPPRKPRTPKPKVPKEATTSAETEVKAGDETAQNGDGKADDDFAAPEAPTQEDAAPKKPARKPAAKKPTTPRAAGKKAKSLRDMMAELYRSLQTMAFVRHWSGKVYQVPISRRVRRMFAGVLVSGCPAVLVCICTE